MIELLVILALFLMWAVVMFRIQSCCSFRIRMIDEDFEGAYRRLPSYNAMVFKHWDKWTYRQWKGWADERGAA